MKAVIFDIDGTLTERVSWLELTRELGASVDEHSTIYEALRSGEMDYPASKERLIQLWQATGHANKSFIMRLFENWTMREEAPAFVQWLQDKGYLLALITGSMDLYAEVVAKRLGIRHYFYNTALVFNDDGALIDYHYEVNQARKKREQLEAFCREQNIAVTDCWAVGDSDNDVELFRLTGHGVLLGDDHTSELVKAARYAVNTFAELKDYL